MAERIASIVRADSGQWAYSLTGTAPWRVYRDGLLWTTQAYSPLLLADPDGDADEPPALEVLDATDVGTPLSVQHPPYLRLMWRGTDAAYYRVDRLIDAEWVEQDVVYEVGQGYYVFQTEALPDGAAESWRVVAVDAAANESVATSIAATIIRHPGPPSIEGSYAAGTLTIAERA